MTIKRNIAGAVVSAAAALMCAQAASAGTVSYPALGNLELSEGTIEMWIIPQFDPVDEEDPSSRYWGFNLFEVRQDDDNFINLIWRSQKGRNGPFARHRQQGFRIPTNWGVVTGWKKQEPHHIAYCWEGSNDWWVIDGKKTKVASSKYGSLKLHINETIQMVLGSPDVHGTVVIDDLRISSVPRNEDEVGFHQPGKLQADPCTLLLDTFDESFDCDGVRQTQPVIMAPSVSGQTGGTPDKKCKFVPGVTNTGLRL